jgi:hypothetical protein
VVITQRTYTIAAVPGLNPTVSFGILIPLFIFYVPGVALFSFDRHFNPEEVVLNRNKNKFIQISLFIEIKSFFLFQRSNVSQLFPTSE